MKMLKIFGIVTVIILGIGAAVIATGTPRFEKHGEEMGWFGDMADGTVMQEMIMAHLKERLQLTEEQEAQILPILKKNLEKRLEMFKNARGKARRGFWALRNEHQEMWQETEQQLAPILTEEQMQELHKLHDEFQEKSQERFKNMSQTRGKFRELFQELNLSAEQKKELFSIFLKYRDNRQEMIKSFLETGKQFSTMILTEDFDEAKVRQTFQQSIAEHEDFFVSRVKMLAEMKTVLTPEQVTLLQQKVPELLDNIQENVQGRHSVFNWFHAHNK